MVKLLKKGIERIIKGTRLYSHIKDLISKGRQRKELARWEKKVRSIPLPHVFK